MVCALGGKGERRWGGGGGMGMGLESPPPQPSPPACFLGSDERDGRGDTGVGGWVGAL